MKGVFVRKSRRHRNLSCHPGGDDYCILSGGGVDPSDTVHCIIDV